MAKYYKDYTEEEKLRIVDDMINSNLTYKELMEKLIMNMYYSLKKQLIQHIQ